AFSLDDGGADLPIHLVIRVHTRRNESARNGHSAKTHGHCLRRLGRPPLQPLHRHTHPLRCITWMPSRTPHPRTPDTHILGVGADTPPYLVLSRRVCRILRK